MVLGNDNCVLFFSQDNNYEQRQLGQLTNEDFRKVTGIAIDPLNGNILVADEGRNRVLVYDDSGAHLWDITFTKGEHEFSPKGIVVSREGGIFVADWKNGKIQVFGRDGVHKESIGRGLGHRCGDLAGPFGLGMLTNGDIVVSESRNHRLQIFTQRGQYVNSFGTRRLKDPAHFCIDQRDRIYVADQAVEWIWVYKKSGHYVGRILLPQFSCSVNVLPGRGNLLVCQAKQKNIVTCSLDDLKWD